MLPCPGAEGEKSSEKLDVSSNPGLIGPEALNTFQNETSSLFGQVAKYLLISKPGPLLVIPESLTSFFCFN